MFELVQDVILDCIKLIPFLFLAYLIMEAIEHRTSEKTKQMIRKTGNFGPFLGGIAGVVPQCGFSAAAANLYAGRVITLGTLIAVFLSTSDEMLPIFLSEQVPVPFIMQVIAIKVVVGIAFGFIIDMFLKNKKTEKDCLQIHDFCEKEQCDCHEGIFRSACKHTFKITLFLFIISLILNILIFIIGEDTLSKIMLQQSFLSIFIAGIIGFIPNCAASVALTSLYLQGMISIGAMIAGLLVGSGVGILILFKVNNHKKENIRIACLLYIIGVVAGLIIQIGNIL